MISMTVRIVLDLSTHTKCVFNIHELHLKLIWFGFSFTGVKCRLYTHITPYLLNGSNTFRVCFFFLFTVNPIYMFANWIIFIWWNPITLPFYLVFGKFSFLFVEKSSFLDFVLFVLLFYMKNRSTGLIFYFVHIDVQGDRGM